MYIAHQVFRLDVVRLFLLVVLDDGEVGRVDRDGRRGDGGGGVGGVGRGGAAPAAPAASADVNGHGLGQLGQHGGLLGGSVELGDGNIFFLFQINAFSLFSFPHRVPHRGRVWDVEGGGGGGDGQAIRVDLLDLALAHLVLAKEKCESLCCANPLLHVVVVLHLLCTISVCLQYASAPKTT